MRWGIESSDLNRGLSIEIRRDSGRIEVGAGIELVPYPMAWLVVGALWWWLDVSMWWRRE